MRYEGSQPWPFPSQLMIGCRADYAGGELRIDETELAEAGWFAPGEWPAIPPPFTIAHRLITGRERTASAITKTENATLITPFIVKNAASSRRRSPGRTSEVLVDEQRARRRATPSQ